MAAKKKNNKPLLKPPTNVQKYNWHNLIGVAVAMLGSLLIIVGVLSWFEYKKFITARNNIAAFSKETYATKNAPNIEVISACKKKAETTLLPSGYSCATRLERSWIYEEGDDAIATIKQFENSLRSRGDKFALEGTEEFQPNSSTAITKIQTTRLLDKQSGIRCSYTFVIDRQSELGALLTVSLMCRDTAMWPYYEWFS